MLYSERWTKQLERMKRSPLTQNISLCDPEPLLFMQNNNSNSFSVAVSLMIVSLKGGKLIYYCLFVCFCKMTFFFPFTCKSLLLQFTHCLGFLVFFLLLPWKVCVCSVGSPVPVHYPTSLHSDPRVLPEPVASLRASHCSPVFYLLDNGKRRDVADLGLAIIICFIYYFFWGGGYFFNLYPSDRWWFCVAPCMPAAFAVLWVPF